MRHFVTLVLSLLISLQFATAALADWVVERTSSSVWASADGQNWRDVRVGETFSGSTWIQTGDRGQVIFARNVERIVFRPGTIATLESQANRTNVGPIRGSVLLSIDPNRGGQTVVKTPHLAAVVLGTVLEVSTNGAQSSVRVDVGRVRVDHGGRSATLEKGQQGVVRANATQRIAIEAARVTSVAPSGSGFGLVTGSPAVVAQDVIDTTNERLRASSNSNSVVGNSNSASDTGRRNSSNNRNVGNGNGNAGNNGNGNGNAGNNGNGNGNAGNNGNGNGNTGNNGNGNGDAGNNGNGNGDAGNNGNGNGNAGNNGNGNAGNNGNDNAGSTGNANGRNREDDNRGNGQGNRDDDDDDDDDDD